MHKRSLAAATAGLALAAAVTAPALGVGAQPRAAQVFTSSVQPDSHVRSGETLVTTSHHAKPKTSYYCVFIIIHGSNYAADTGSASVVTSNKHGHVSCSKTFEPYSATDQKGKTRHCPTTRKDRKAGFSCAVSLADQATQGQTSASVAKFTAAH